MPPPSSAWPPSRYLEAPEYHLDVKVIWMSLGYLGILLAQSLCKVLSTASTRLAFDWLPESSSSDLRFEITFQRRCQMALGVLSTRQWSSTRQCLASSGSSLQSTPTIWSRMLTASHRTSATFRSLHQSETAASECPIWDCVVWPRLPTKHLVAIDIENE